MSLPSQVLRNKQMKVWQLLLPPPGVTHWWTTRSPG